MKKLFTVLIVISMLIPVALHAQEDILFGEMEKIAHGVYAGHSSRLTAFDRQSYYVSGWRTGWIIDHKVFIGLSFNHIPIRLEKTVMGDKSNVYFEYHGGEVGYIFYSDKVLHFGMRTFYGPGLVTIEDRVTGKKLDDDEVFVVEPMLFGEVNITNWCRIELGGGYRQVYGADRPGLNNGVFKGIIGDIIVKFGIF